MSRWRNALAARLYNDLKGATDAEDEALSIVDAVEGVAEIFTPNFRESVYDVNVLVAVGMGG